jgi:hypothetical protein
MYFRSDCMARSSGIEKQQIVIFLFTHGITIV